MASAEREEDPSQPASPLQPHRPGSAIPKRKPVAAPVPVFVPATTIAATAPSQKAGAASETPIIIDEKGPPLEWEATTEPSSFTGEKRSKFAWPFAASPSFGALRRFIDSKLPFANDKGKRRLVIGGIIAAIVIIFALIIGLSVGLTVGRKYDLVSFNPPRRNYL